MTFSFIIPNYNGEKILKNNLPKLFDLFHLDMNDVEFIIVDDGSVDNSVTYITSLIQSEKYKNLNTKLVKNNVNVGFSSTVNRGVDEANGEFVILFNTDVIPENNFLKDVVKHFSDQKAFAVGFMDKSAEGDKVVLRGRGVGRWQRGLLHHKKGDVDKKNTLWVSGGSSIFRKSIWNILGGMYEIYNPFYWEDIDLSYRALKAGYTIVFDSEISVIHEHDKGAIKTHFKKNAITKTAYRNQIIFAWINMTDRSLLRAHMIWLPISFINALFKKDWVFIQGMLQAFGMLRKALEYRIKAQKQAVIPDSEVIQMLAE